MTGSATGSTLAPRTPAPVFSSATAFSSLARHPSVCGPRPTQPSVAPNFATTLVVKYARRCGGGPWSCYVTIVAFKVLAIPFQGSPRSHFLDSVCHWRLAHPDSVTPPLIQVAGRHGCVLVHHSVSKRQHLACVGLPKGTHKCSSAIVLHVVSRQHAACCRSPAFIARGS